MLNTNVLRGKIIAKFGRLSALSEKLGWKPSRLSRIMSGRQKLTVDDMEAIASALELQSSVELVEVFSLSY